MSWMTTDTLYVLEFKVDGTPEEALAQINSKEYAIPYQVGDWKIRKVGITFSITHPHSSLVNVLNLIFQFCTPMKAFRCDLLH